MDYRKALEELEIAILAVSQATCRPVFVNHAAWNLLGLEVDAPSSLVRSFFPELGARITGQVSGTWRNEGKVLGYTIYPAENAIVWILVKDITEKERLQRLAETMALMHSLESVFAGLLHELGNPLNGIKTAVTLLHREAGQMDRHLIQDFLGRILEQIGRMERLLQTMRTFNALDDMELGPVDLRRVLQELFRMSLPTFSARGIDVSMHFLTDETTVRGNEIALEQVFMNLITNAIDAVEGQPHPRIRVVGHRRGENLIVEVADNGKGIPKENLNQIFLPFFTTKARGTGLGLALVKKLVTLMGGSVSASSGEAPGTVMTITLEAIDPS